MPSHNRPGTRIEIYVPEHKRERFVLARELAERTRTAKGYRSLSAILLEAIELWIAAEQATLAARRRPGKR